jgi:site-specific DNA-methyltransferase (adenine-specific)
MVTQNMLTTTLPSVTALTKSKTAETHYSAGADVQQAFVSSVPMTNIELVLADALQWMAQRNENSIHAIVTDQPYALVEYDEKNHCKLRKGSGGVWRIPPTFDGSQRSPLPRFTVLTMVRGKPRRSGR